MESVVVLVSGVVINRVAELLTLDRHPALREGCVRVGREQGVEPSRESLVSGQVVVVGSGWAAFTWEPPGSGLREVRDSNLSEGEAGPASKGREVPEDVAKFDTDDFIEPDVPGAVRADLLLVLGDQSADLSC